MFVGSQEQFATAQATKRVQELCGNIDIGNGTSVADAIVSALEIDLRISGRKDGAAVWNALTDREIADLAFHMTWTYERQDERFTLPLGTVVRSGEIGDVKIGGESWLLDAAKPGLHPMETMRRDAHGPNFELLCAHIARLTRNLACRRLGLPSPVLVVDRVDHHLLHFGPCSEAGDVVLQRRANGTEAPRFPAASPGQILEFAESIVADMRAFWKRRKAIAARSNVARGLADAAAAKYGAEVQLVAVDLSNQRESERIDMSVHYLAIDEAMRVGPVLGLMPDRGHVTADHYRPPAGVCLRPDELAELRELGADGRIDDMAVAVATAAPGGVAAVFAQLATAYSMTFEIPTDATPMFATLYWRDGTIEADVSIAEKLDCYGTSLDILGNDLPDTIKNSLPGRTVACVAELPFACSCEIRSVQDLDGGFRLDLKIGTSLVNLSSGLIWDGPDRDD